MLARLYEDAGVSEEAEKMYIAAKDAKPNDPAVYMQLAGYYNRQGQFDKTIDALEAARRQGAEQPRGVLDHLDLLLGQGVQRLALKDNEKKEFVRKGIEAVDHAMQIKPDYAEAMVYKGLLLRLEANLEKDPAKQRQLLKEADALHEKSEEIRKKKATGA